MRDSRAFTLIELLVVVGVIAVLMGLLIPQLSEARRVAKTTQCVSNYKSMGAVMRTYATDYDDTLPKYNWSGYDWAPVWFRSYGWANNVSYPLSGSPDVRTCLQGYVPPRFFLRLLAMPLY